MGIELSNTSVVDCAIASPHLFSRVTDENIYILDKCCHFYAAEPSVHSATMTVYQSFSSVYIAKLKCKLDDVVKLDSNLT